MQPKAYNFLWLSLALMPLLIIIALLPVQPHDYWWYVRLGKDILEIGGVPHTETYSFLQIGRPIVYQSWLSGVVFWLVYKTGEIPLTVFLAFGVILSSYAMLWLMLKETKIDSKVAALLVVIAGLSGSNNWTIRPQLFAYPLFLASLWLLIKWQNKNNQYLWLLILLGFVWANLHGSFILLFILMGIALVFGEGERKKLLLISIIAWLVTFINPYGFQLWKSIFDTFISPGIRNLSPEWLPPQNAGWQMNIYFAWLILLVPLAAFTRQKISRFDWILFLAFTWLGLTGIRYVIWDLFVIAFLTAKLLPEFKGIIPEIKFPSINYVCGFLFLLFPLTLLPGVRTIWWQGSPSPLGLPTPVAAVEWLLDHPEFRGEMWNDVIFGSYLIYAAPSRPVSMDTRIQVAYTAEQAERYLYVQSAQPKWETYLQQDRINLLFLAHSQSALVSAVKESKSWCLQYRDEVALIFTRCETK